MVWNVGDKNILGLRARFVTEKGSFSGPVEVIGELWSHLPNDARARLPADEAAQVDHSFTDCPREISEVGFAVATTTTLQDSGE